MSRAHIPGASGLTDGQKAERRLVVQKMRQAVDEFYARAARCEVHTFVEFAGLMREYTTILERMTDEGVDFHGSEPAAADYNLAYLAEKIDCIYGGAAARSPDGTRAFLGVLASRGWPIDVRPARRAGAGPMKTGGGGF